MAFWLPTPETLGGRKLTDTARNIFVLLLKLDILLALEETMPPRFSQQVSTIGSRNPCKICVLHHMIRCNGKRPISESIKKVAWRQAILAVLALLVSRRLGQRNEN